MTPLLLALLAAGPVGEAGEDPAWLHVRGGLPWTRLYLDLPADATPPVAVRIAFLGGSITEGEGYRPLVEAKLRARFPEATFEFHNGGVASTGSTTGAFRFWDVALGGEGWSELPEGNFPGPTGYFTSLVVTDFAVNDDQDERLPAADAGWGTEAIARMQLAPIVGGPDRLFVHFPFQSTPTSAGGDVPASVAAHERVAEHYQIPTVNVAAEVTRRIDAGELTWEEYGGTHPGPIGHELAAELITDGIARCLARSVSGNFPPANLTDPPEPLRADALDAAFLLRVGSEEEEDRKLLTAAVATDTRWATGTPDWDALRGACRDRFRDEVLLRTTTPGATLTLDPAAVSFTAVGLYVLAGPDAGAVEVAVPGEPTRTVQLYHDPHSANLHYPRTVLLYRAAEPPPGPVTVTVVPGERGGTAVRVVGVGLGAIARDRAKPDGER